METGELLKHTNYHIAYSTLHVVKILFVSSAL